MKCKKGTLQRRNATDSISNITSNGRNQKCRLHDSMQWSQNPFCYALNKNCIILTELYWNIRKYPIRDILHDWNLVFKRSMVINVKEKEGTPPDWRNLRKATTKRNSWIWVWLSYYQGHHKTCNKTGKESVDTQNNVNFVILSVLLYLVCPYL